MHASVSPLRKRLITSYLSQDLPSHDDNFHRLRRYISRHTIHNPTPGTLCLSCNKEHDESDSDRNTHRAQDDGECDSANAADGALLTGISQPCYVVVAADRAI